MDIKVQPYNRISQPTLEPVVIQQHFSQSR